MKFTMIVALFVLILSSQAVESRLKIDFLTGIRETKSNDGIVHSGEARLNAAMLNMSAQPLCFAIVEVDFYNTLAVSFAKSGYATPPTLSAKRLIVFSPPLEPGEKREVAVRVALVETFDPSKQVGFVELDSGGLNVAARQLPRPDASYADSDLAALAGMVSKHTQHRYLYQTNNGRLLAPELPADWTDASEQAQLFQEYNARLAREGQRHMQFIWGGVALVLFIVALLTWKWNMSRNHFPHSAVDAHVFK